MQSTSEQTIADTFADEPFEPDPNPQQFAISELLMAMALVALVMVAVSPYLRTLTKPVLATSQPIAR